MNRQALLSVVRSTIQRYEMLPEGSAVLCGFSGGADSVTLLSVLQTLSAGMEESPAFPLVACHVNHGIRGEEAKRDEDFCRAFCEQRNIPLLVHRVDVPALAEQQGLSEETCGRQVRYQCFAEDAERLAKKHPECTQVLVATAHTASDDVETMLFHLVRGTGLSGLCGIPPVRDNIIRPLIHCTREDIEAYCREQSLSYVTDSSNEDTGYARNKIRLELLPILRELNEGAEANMVRTMKLLATDRAFLNAQRDTLLSEAMNASSKDTIVLNADVLAGGEDAVLSRALSKVCSDFAGVQTEQKHVEQMVKWLRKGTKQAQLQIPGGAFVTLCKNTLILSWELPKTASGDTRRGQIRKMPRGEWEKSASPLENSLDYDKIEPNFMVRTRLPGDTFAPVGRGMHKKLKTLFQEAGVPPEDRDRKLLVESGGEVVWLEGFGAAEGFQVTEGSQTVGIVEVLP